MIDSLIEKTGDDGWLLDMWQIIARDSQPKLNPPPVFLLTLGLTMSYGDCLLSAKEMPIFLELLLLEVFLFNNIIVMSPLQ